MTVPEAKTVVVTGGSRGLGQGIVQGLLDDGCNVATCSRSSTDAVAAWSNDPGTRDRFLYAAFDLTDRSAADAFVKESIARFGAIDVLVNNAGLAREGVIALFRDEDVDEVVDINLKSTIHMTRLVARRMLVQRSGCIVNISSIIGLSGYRGLAVYGATKAALDGFTRALARELGPVGITVNSIAPGYLRTEMTHGLDEDQLGQIERRTPMGRLGTPEDVVGAVRFLMSPAAAFITGHVLVIDGGLTA
jgi:3-oxoacyl-[acyl-carrier protein] reductase